MERQVKALKYFRNKFNCSQSVFTVFGTDHGLSENDCLKTSCAFGAGMGRQQLTCGAVTGALIGIYYKNPNDPRLIVPKLNPSMGWTFNWASPYSYVTLICIILITIASIVFL